MLQKTSSCRAGALAAVTLLFGTLAPLTFGQASRTVQADGPAKLALDANTVRYTITGLGGDYVFGGVTGDVAQHTLAHIPLMFSRTQMVLEHLQDFSGEKNLDQAAQRQIVAQDTPGNTLGEAMVVEKELARRNIPHMISIWRIPKEWMGAGGGVAEGKWPALEAAIGQYLVHIKEKYGSEPVSFSFNEPNMGVHVKFSAEDHHAAIKRIGAYLAKLNLKTKMTVGDVVHPGDINYLRPTLDDPAAMKYVGVISFHSWGGGTAQVYARWAELAAQTRLPLYVGESGPNSRAHKDGSLNTPRLDLAEMHQTQQLFLYACPNAVAAWEYTQDYSLMSKENGKLVPNFRYALQQHWTHFIPPASQALKTTGSDGQVLFTAFRFTDSGKPGYSLHVSNVGAARQITISGLPAALQEFHVVATTEEKLFQKQPPVSVQDGHVTLDVPAGSLTTLTTREIPPLE